MSDEQIFILILEAVKDLGNNSLKNHTAVLTLGLLMNYNIAYNSLMLFFGWLLVITCIIVTAQSKESHFCEPHEWSIIHNWESLPP